MTGIFTGTHGLAIPFSGNEELDTNINVASTQYDQDDDTEAQPCDAFGFADGPDYLGLGDFGSIDKDPATYHDGVGTLRTVTAVYYTESCVGSGDDDNLHFTLNGEGVTDSDDTFVSIDYNSVNYTRSSATAATSGNGGTHWRWINISPNGPTSGTPAFVVNI